LDGVMNDQVYPYILDRRLVAYMDTMNLKYFADYPGEINDVSNATILGYSVRELMTRLRPVYSTPKVEGAPYWTDFTLYRLSSGGDGSSSQKDR